MLLFLHVPQVEKRLLQFSVFHYVHLFRKKDIIIRIIKKKTKLFFLTLYIQDMY